MKRPVVILLHLGYWFMYVMLLMVMYMLSMSATGKSLQVNQQFTSLFFTAGIVPAIPAFYFFYTWVFARFLHRKRILLLVLVGVFACLLCSIVGIIIVSFFNPQLTFFSNGITTAYEIVISFSILIAFPNALIALVMRGFISWYGDITLKEQLNRKNYETELALIKSQINPHFLFNTLNNIDVLIERDPAKASAYLNKLSDIMRFMLYETKTEKIPLEKELGYIGKYLELQRIRSANTELIQYSIEGETRDWMIEPMLFIPFIENAFKHMDNTSTGNAIKILFTLSGDTLNFQCENNYHEKAIVKTDDSGLGSEIIRKRLALLYPNTHTLEIAQHEGRYMVKLTLHGKNN